MREVEFQECGMKNFGPYIDPMILSFPNDILHLLTGPNGIGKTMALDSIPFTLYGITSKKAKGDDVINNSSEKNCKTWVKFKVDEDQYLVTRYRKYTRYGDTVILNKNGEDIKKGHKEVLPEIEKLICPQKAFMNTLMFGQKVKDFFTDLVDSDKKEIFRKILGLEQYIELYKQTDGLLKDLKKLQNNLTNQVEIDKGLLADAIAQIETLKNLKNKFYDQKAEDIQTLSSSLGNNERLLDIWTTTLEELTSKSLLSLEEINKELSKVQNELNSLEKNTNSEIQTLEKQQQVKNLELKEEATNKKNKISEETKIKVEEINKKLSEILEKSFTKKSETQNLKHEIDVKINKLKSNQEANLERINEIESNVLNSDTSICPTCEQDVTEIKDILLTKVKNRQIEIDNDEETIAQLQLQKSDIENQYQESLIAVNDQSELLNNEKTKLINNEEKMKKEIDNKLLALNNQVSNIVNNQKSKIIESQSESKQALEEKEKALLSQKEDRTKLDNEINEIKETISNLKQDIKSVEIQIENKKAEEYDETQLISYINKKQNLKDSIENKKEELKNVEKQITIHEFWKTAFSSSGIPSMLIDDSIPFMNQQITKYLDLLTNGRYIVSFDTLAEIKTGEFRDKIAVHVIDTHTKANSRVQLSGGQTRIVDIATILTLGDLQSHIQDVKINILLFDEIFDSLDYDNATYVSKVLNKLKVGKSIYVISHQHQDHLEADEVLEFK